MLTLNNQQHQANPIPEANFKEKVRCGEVYRNLYGNEMFQKFYYRCLECSMDFESSPEFEEHVIVHYLQDDEDCAIVDPANKKTNENVIAISSDDEDEENDYMFAVEVASLVEENISENDLPLPLMQMLSEQSGDSCDQLHFDNDNESETGSNEDEQNVAFPCDGLRRQALHQYSEPEKCCTRCPAYFNTKSDLNFHLHIHTLPNTVTCPHCYEVYANADKLREHIRIRRKRIRKSTKGSEYETEQNDVINSQIYKKAKNHSSTTDALPQENNTSTTPTITMTATESNTDDSMSQCPMVVDSKSPNENHKENVDAIGGKNSTTNSNTNCKRKETDNNERNSTVNSTTLLEINQTEHSNNTSAVKDV